MRHRRRNRGRNAAIVRARSIAVLAILTVTVLLQRRAAPMMKTVIRQQAEQSAAEALSTVVTEILSAQTVPAFLSVTRGENGEIQSVTTDTQAVNRFQAEMTLHLQATLRKAELHRCQIALGTLLGGALLRERGPKLTFLFRLASSVSCTAESAFESAGINQTVHQVRLRVTANAYLLVPGATEPIASSAVYPLAEEVIVGQIPQVVLSQSS